MDEQTLFRLDTDLMFNTLMAVNIRLCIIMVAFPILLREQMDFSPHFVSLVFVAAVIFCAVWTFACLKILHFFTKIYISTDGIRCQKGENIFSYRLIKWESIKSIKEYKVYKLHFLKILLKDKSKSIQLPLHLANFNSFQKLVHKYTDQSHPLRAHI